VPDNVTAPVVAVLGVNPVVPALNVVTPDVTLAQVPSPRKYDVLEGVPVTAPGKAVTLEMIVPLVGKVTDVLAVAAMVCVNAPECVTLPASESVPVPKVKDDPDPEVVSKVPDVGKVTEVLPVAVNV
jgi:hypothetical protein